MDIKSLIGGIVYLEGYQKCSREYQTGVGGMATLRGLSGGAVKKKRIIHFWKCLHDKNATDFKRMVSFYKLL